jgi:hypothetical protein
MGWWWGSRWRPLFQTPVQKKKKKRKKKKKERKKKKKEGRREEEEEEEEKVTAIAQVTGIKDFNQGGAFKNGED